MATLEEVIATGEAQIAEAIGAAKICDLEKAARLQSLAMSSMREAFKMFQKDPKQQSSERQKKFFDAMKQLVDGLRDYPTHLAKCEKRTKKRGWKPSGSFDSKGTKGLLKGTAPKNRIRFEFTVDEDVSCEQLCVVQVYHLENAKTGKTVLAPSKADKRSGFSFHPTPRDDDAQDGYVVDVNPYEQSSSGDAILSKNPCYPSKKAGRVIVASDQPDFVKPGFVAYFETCVVCMDTTPPRILGSMRWRHTSKPGRSKILRRTKKTKDWGAPSEPFRKALAKWMKNHK